MNKVKESKEWMYNFKEGGWNTQLATSKEEAIEQANQRWFEHDGLTPRPATFRLVEENREEYESNLRSFW